MLLANEKMRNESWPCHNAKPPIGCRHNFCEWFCPLIYEIIFASSNSSLSKFSSFLSTANTFTLLHSLAELKICLKTIFVWSAETSSNVAKAWS